ncbi:MAG: hypothetical protein JOZ57_09700 [Abitibacteriaceae bacterium]|nr:hypothetical protein [Abditibacteriaceae bacterium]
MMVAMVMAAMAVATAAPAFAGAGVNPAGNSYGFCKTHTNGEEVPHNEPRCPGK